jgi:hypothetical protein
MMCCCGTGAAAVVEELGGPLLCERIRVVHGTALSG